MTWTEAVTQIDLGMKLEKYSKQIENKEIDSEDSSNKYIDMGYSLRAINASYFQTTGLSGIASYGVELKISYLTLTDEEQQIAIDKFHTLLKKFTNKDPFTNFAGFINDPIPEYDQGDKQIVIGIIQMFYGFKGL